MGAGSAATEKYHLRVEGETAAGDDVLLEVKEVRDLTWISCIRVEPGPGRIVVGRSRVAHQPFRHAGAENVAGSDFRVHSWPLNDVEPRIQDLRSPEESNEVACGVGVLLGRGHSKGGPARDAERLRRQRVQGLPSERVRRVGVEFSGETIRAWERFPAATRP